MQRMTCFALALVCLAGCKPAEPPAETVPVDSTTPVAPAEPAPPGQTEEPEVAPTSSQPSPSSAEKAPADDVSLQILDWESTRALVDQHPGKVVVMDLWATYCPPCIAEFPNLVQLDRTQGDRVACISVSLDYEGLDDMPPESYRDKVMRFLTKQGATFQNVLLSTSAEEMFSEKIPQQSIPVVYVFDQQGKLAGQFPDPQDPAEFTYQEQILPLVKKLLNKSE